MSHIMRKPDFGQCKNKGADQLRSNCEADQHLYFCYTDSTILSEFEISSLWPPSVLVQLGFGPGRKPCRRVFSHRGSYTISTVHVTAKQSNISQGIACLSLLYIYCNALAYALINAKNLVCQFNGQ